MDAIKFIEEKERMCKTYESCILCPACLNEQCIFGMRSGFSPEQQINTVNAWAEQYPRKTRRAVFLKQYPNAKVIGDTGIPIIYPCAIEQAMDGVMYCNSLSCSECRRKFWMEEI